MSNKERVLDTDNINVIGAHLTENPRHATKISEIRDLAEQQMYILLKKKLPSDWEITPEKFIVVITFTDDKNEIHEAQITPDFVIGRPDRNEINFLEITRANINGTDPKAYQKTIMRLLKEHYVPTKILRSLFLYGKHLDKIQAEHPEVDFVNGRKVREEVSI
ncbi:MAG: hypothetical protein AAB662_02910 [Patescibacteria group bacterium]